MMNRRALTLAWILGISLVPSLAAAQAGAPSDAQKTEARSHFDLGLSHFDREEWQAALVEFLKSRELFPSKGNTKNAAICLRKVGRFDESLTMFETLVRDFPDISPTDRTLAEREILDLQASVGTIDVRDAPEGASVAIDATDRGKTPLKAPIRLSAGTHTVRVTMDGSLPFEARVDLVGRQALVVHAKLALLTQAGRLRVTEHDGKPADLVVDGSVVGPTPFDGALAPGRHTVWLRGEGNVGSPPESVVLSLDRPVTLTLVAEELRGAIRVDPTPGSAEVFIDDVSVGKGPWEGRLRIGNHKLVIVADGFVKSERAVTLGPDAREDVKVALERDPTLVGGKAGLSLELDLGASLGLLVGGDVRSGCTSPCSASLPVGFAGIVHGTYSFSSGFGLGIHAGYMLLFGSLSTRTLTLNPVGRAPTTSTIDESQRLGGVVAGIEAQYRTHSDWPLTLRVGVGVVIGSMNDKRTGTFNDSKGAPFALGTSQNATGVFLEIAPEVRIGRKFGDHFSLDVGVQFSVLTALTRAKWDGTQTVPAGGDGLATSATESLTGGVVLALTPGVGARYEF